MIRVDYFEYHTNPQISLTQPSLWDLKMAGNLCIEEMGAYDLVLFFSLESGMAYCARIL